MPERSAAPAMQPVASPQVRASDTQRAVRTAFSASMPAAPLASSRSHCVMSLAPASAAQSEATRAHTTPAGEVVTLAPRQPIVDSATTSAMTAREQIVMEVTASFSGRAERDPLEMASTAPYDRLVVAPWKRFWWPRRHQ